MKRRINFRSSTVPFYLLRVALCFIAAYALSNGFIGVGGAVAFLAVMSFFGETKSAFPAVFLAVLARSRGFVLLFEGVAPLLVFEAAYLIATRVRPPTAPVCALFLAVAEACAFCVYLLPSFESVSPVETAVSAAISVSLFPLLLTGLKALFTRRLPMRLSADEAVCLFVSACLVFCGLFGARFFGVSPFSPIAVFAVLSLPFVTSGGFTAAGALCIGLAKAAESGYGVYLGVFALFAVIAKIFGGISRYVSAFSVLLVDLILIYLLGLYPDFTYIHIAESIVGAVAFAVTPDGAFKTFQTVFCGQKREERLEGEIIRNKRLGHIEKLGRLSQVFSETARLYRDGITPKTSALSAEELCFNDCRDTVCAGCAGFGKCYPSTASSGASGKKTAERKGINANSKGDFICDYGGGGASNVPSPPPRHNVGEVGLLADCVASEGANSCVMTAEKNDRFAASGIRALIRRAMEKGRVSLVDLPDGLARACVMPNVVIAQVNRHVANYREYLIASANAEQSRRMCSRQIEGIARILQALSFEAYEPMFDEKREASVLDALIAGGVNVSEVSCYEMKRIRRRKEPIVISPKAKGGGSVNALSKRAFGAGGETGKTNAQKADDCAFAEAGLYVTVSVGRDDDVSKVIGLVRDALPDARLMPQKDGGVERVACGKTINLCPCPRYDASFGASTVKKYGSSGTGDTHSFSALGDSRFMLALCDGMGSGERAGKVSEAVISLIENYYRAGFAGEYVLECVGDLVSCVFEELFCALDVVVVDLDELTAEFIKLGAPASFVRSGCEAEVVEGGSLPLGILENADPVSTAKILRQGDTVLLVSDGVTDAMGGADAVADYFCEITSLNPQTVANEIVDRAIYCCGGRAADDMTALAFRVYERD